MFAFAAASLLSIWCFGARLTNLIFYRERTFESALFLFCSAIDVTSGVAVSQNRVVPAAYQIWGVDFVRHSQKVYSLLTYV